MPYNPHKLKKNNNYDNSSELYNSFANGAKNTVRKANKFASNLGKRFARKKAKSMITQKVVGSIVTKFSAIFLLKFFLVFLLIIVLIAGVGSCSKTNFAGLNLDFMGNGTVGITKTKSDSGASTQNQTGDTQNPSNTSSSSSSGDGFKVNMDDQQAKQFYQHFSNISYWLLDSSSGKLTQSTEDVPIRDYYKRETQYSLTPGFLYALNSHLFQEQIIYPEQFVQPVYNEIKDVTVNGVKKKSAFLKPLTNDKEEVIAESNVKKFNFTPPTNFTADYWQGKFTYAKESKVKSVANYGLGSIISYIPARKVVYASGTYVDDVWTGSHEDKKIDSTNFSKAQPEKFGPEGFDNPNKNYVDWYQGQPQNIDSYYLGDEQYNRLLDEFSYSQPANVKNIDFVLRTEEDLHLMDEVLTYQGKYTFGYAPSSAVMDESLPSEMRNKKIGSFIYNFVPEHSYDPPRYNKLGIEKKISASWSRGNLYRQYTGKVYEIMPRSTWTKFNGEDMASYQERMNKENKTKDEEIEFNTEVLRKFKYLKDYAINFESFVPEEVLKKFDFAQRVGSDYVIDATQVGRTAISTALLQLDSTFAKFTPNETVKNLLEAMSARESGNGANISTGPAWGIMQIEDTHYGKGVYPWYRGSGGGKTSVMITNDVSTDERLNKVKSIQWASEYYNFLYKKYNEDALIALQAYNFGDGAMDKLLKHAEELGVSWMMCIDDIDDLMGGSHGDHKYVANVLEYYHGDLSELTQGGDVGFFEGLGQKLSDLLGLKYDTDNKPLIPYKYCPQAYDFDLMMRQATAFDNGLTVDESDYETYTGIESGDGRDANEAISSYDDLLEAVPTIGDYSSPLAFKNPVVSSPFGWRIHPVTGERKFHNGIDLAVPIGTPLYAINDGVYTTQSDSASGNYVRIDHGDGIVSYYMHMSSFASDLKPGQHIAKGTFLGMYGNTGRSTGPHLHFGIKKDGSWINPYYFVFPPESSQ